MDDKEVRKYWNKNAENWTKLSRMGYDKYRNLLNTPTFFKMLPDISNQRGLDIGCGEGYNTRIASKLGAKLTGIDISELFIKNAIDQEQKEPLGIEYKVASAINIPFQNNYFDFTLATMSLMDIPEPKKAIIEAFRVTRFGGFFQFSISHPCFDKSGSQWLKDENGRRDGFIVRNYFKVNDGDIEEWIFSAAPKEITRNMAKFRIPRFSRTLSDWLNLIIKCGFIFLEEFSEPCLSQENLDNHPEYYYYKIIPYSLIIRCRKPKKK